MDKLILLALLVVLVATVSSLPAVNIGLGLPVAVDQKTTLNAGDRDLLSKKIALDKQNRKQARLDAKKERLERRRLRAAAKEAARLRANKALDFETYDNKAKFSNLDITNQVSAADKTNLLVNKESRFDSNFGLKHNDGFQSSTGTKLSAADNLEVDTIKQAELLGDEELLANDQLSAAAASQDLLNANGALLNQNENSLFFQNLNQNQLLLPTGFLVAPFGNPFAFKKF